jgi:hypothetical protein
MTLCPGIPGTFCLDDEMCGRGIRCVALARKQEVGKLMEVLRDPVQREELFKKAEVSLIRGLERQEPWAICFFQEGKRLLDECLTIDADGKIVYNLDLGSDKDNIVQLKKENAE